MIDYLISLGTLRALHRHGVTEASVWHIGIEWASSHRIPIDAYCPPAIVSPWSGRWHKGSTPAALADILAIGSHRLDALRAAAVAACGPETEDKPHLVTSLRNTLPDDAVEWVDACWIVEANGDITPVWSAGTGGNWGSQCLGSAAVRAAIDVVTERSGEYAINVYGNRPLTPLEYLLALEGLMMLSPSPSRRLSDDQTQPCRTQRCISQMITEERIIGSYWLPMWDRPTGYQEARDALGNHPGWLTDVDAARWIATGKPQRGIPEYGRWAIVQEGMNYRGLCP